MKCQIIYKKFELNSKHITLYIGEYFHLNNIYSFLHILIKLSQIQPNSLLKSIFFWDMTPCSALSCTRRSSETSGTSQRTTRRHIPEEDTLQNHRCENLKSYIIHYYFNISCIFLYISTF
jgi:hypothetical protein